MPVETFRYAATGGFNTVLDLFLYFICYNFILDKQTIDLNVVVVSPHIASFLMVFPITFTIGFLFAKYITFTSSDLRGRTQLLRYIITVSGAIILNYLFLKLFVEQLGIWPTFSKMLTTGLVIIYSYTSQRYFTFKTNGVETI